MRQRRADGDATLHSTTSADEQSLGKKSTAIPSRTPNLSNAWEFAGWGRTEDLELPEPDGPADGSDPEAGDSRKVKHEAKLGQWRATSIAGNDLIASVFYTIGTCFTVAGPLTPFALILVALALYPFRKILAEVSTALPMNGGTYNCLLNTASKSAASVAASLSLISYTATAVVSASTATACLAGELPEVLDSRAVFWLTVGVLIVFAAIVALGMQESSLVALIIFTIHCITLLVFMVVCAVYWATNGSSTLIENWNLGLQTMPTGADVVRALFLGYCIGLLGVTGIETCSNYVEHQGPGVFPKTMRNLWWLSFFFNAPTALFTMAVIPQSVIAANPSGALSAASGVAGGDWLRWWMTVDAVVVLCAGVLTSFVGVSGLIERMAGDNILPRFLLSRNRFTNSPHWIIASFLVVCISLYGISGGDVTSLSGVLAVALPSVLCTFAIGDLLLKYHRDRLPRPVRSTSLAVLIALLTLMAGLAGNLYLQPILIAYFFGYTGTLLVVMLALLHRVRLAKTAFFYVDKVLVLHRWPIGDWLVAHIRHWKRQSVIFFADTDEIHILNKAVLYVNRNESTTCLKIVHFYDDDIVMLRRLEASRRALDRLYPKITIDLILIRDQFNPESIDRLEKELQVPKTLMFMSCPGPTFPYGIGELGGVRIIML
ncbi:amino acid permease-domain-containing protein [Thamnocephalis sphaerospora]|uniref:Amino acid permease-domain-containing protein n=1 Tax=Thamnocephalis sphaerospora TaxID=78915 RepID=A0A4P9XT03_9FUNG|nr:amino acid permease-domain-containing protein [Thamnocephalis sphaerospora]|eukprot:RKP09267.1 amino acid permease-domain-containing protein [Thamnocephalis sphaerospora]